MKLSVIITLKLSYLPQNQNINDKQPEIPGFGSENHKSTAKGDLGRWNFSLHIFPILTILYEPTQNNQGP